MLYIINFSRIYYGKEENRVSDYINKIFPDISDKIVGYKYSIPKNTRFISLYIYLGASAMKSGNYKLDQTNFGIKINRPDLIAENSIIEFLNIVNLDLNNILQDVKDLINFILRIFKTDFINILTTLVPKIEKKLNIESIFPSSKILKL